MTMNPAVFLLLRFHLASRIRRAADACSTPRRLMLTLGALLLGIVWLGQTIASVCLRDPYETAALRSWTSLILMLYFTWHILRVTYKRPDNAIEWSAAEAAQRVGGPFRRRELLLYRFIIILTSTLPKALLTAFVLLPDLWWSGLPGIVLALVFLECFRLAIDIAVNCMTARAYRIARWMVFGALMLLTAGVTRHFDVAGSARRTSTWATQTIQDLQTLRLTVPVRVAERPFEVFADVITARDFSAELALNTLLASLMVAALLILIERLDSLHEALVARRQQALLPIASPSAAGSDEDPGFNVALPRIPIVAGIGPICWRQFKSAARYRGSVAVAVAIPAVLSCLPLYSVRDASYAFLAVVAAVVFYSFVLLPEAIKFDFRLDCDHLSQLKMLPIPAFRLVLGQLAVPILIATAFQFSVYLVAGVLRPVSLTLLFSAMLLSVPMNVLFVAIDNLIFLLYPHRPTQEGFEAFVRTILKFTFKSVLLGLAGTFVIFWSASSRVLVDAAGAPHLVTLIFVAGVCLVTWLTAALALAGVTHTFQHFDVSQSVPA
jgi:hypothetical protein